MSLRTIVVCRVTCRLMLSLHSISIIVLIALSIIRWMTDLRIVVLVVGVWIIIMALLIIINKGIIVKWTWGALRIKVILVVNSFVLVDLCCLDSMIVFRRLVILDKILRRSSEVSQIICAQAFLRIYDLSLRRIIWWVAISQANSKLLTQNVFINFRVYRLIFV